MYQNLLDNLNELKLEKIYTYLPAFLDNATESEVPFIDALCHLTELELDFRREKSSQSMVESSGFPFVKTLKDFDFDYQESINKTQIFDFNSLRFMQKAENLLFYGSPGVGKTHLAVAIGITAARSRLSTCFISCHNLISQLNKAYKQNKFEQKLRSFAKFNLLIIDEIGFLPVDKQGANLFFQLISARYEKNSTIITTNQAFSKWADVFASPTLANAILDRLLHHCHIIKITGLSYRLKDSVAAFAESDIDSKSS
jgi:DNA replication protein DnaC